MAAQVAALLFNANRKSGTPATGPKDWIPRTAEETQDRPQSGKEMSLAAMAWCAAVGGRIEARAG